MPRYFTQYWTAAQCAEDAPYAGHLLEFTAGKHFRERGITAGDIVYAVTVRRGRLFLIGRLTVREILGESEALRLLGADNLVEGADEYIIAASATPMHFHHRGSMRRYRTAFVRRITTQQAAALCRAGRSDRQTLQTNVSLSQHQRRRSISSCHPRSLLNAPRMSSNQTMKLTTTAP